MKSLKISSIIAFYLCVNCLNAQINLAKGYNFEDNTFVLNPSGEISNGVWYAFLRGSTVADFGIVKDESSGIHVFRAATKVVNNRSDAYLMQKIASVEPKYYQLGFWFKMMHRNAKMRVEVNGFDWEGTAFDINYVGGVIPGNWMYYELPIDLRSVNTGTSAEEQLTVSFYFNNQTDAITLSSPGITNEAWEFFISNLSLIENLPSLLDGGFEQWTSSHPVAPQQWTTSGDACFERCYGHKFSDYGIKAAVANAETLPQITTKSAVPLPADQFKVYLWAKADTNATQLQVKVADEVKTVAIDKEYKRYAVQFANPAKLTSSNITFCLLNDETYYIDQVSVEEDEEDIPTRIAVAVSGKPVAVHYYNLQGVEVVKPTKGNVYLLKEVFESGTVSVSKTIKK